MGQIPTTPKRKTVTPVHSNRWPRKNRIRPRRADSLLPPEAIVNGKNGLAYCGYCGNCSQPPSSKINSTFSVRTSAIKPITAKWFIIHSVTFLPNVRFKNPGFAWAFIKSFSHCAFILATCSPTAFTLSVSSRVRISLATLSKY